MNNIEKIKELIKFLKDNNIRLSSTEITSSYCEFLSYNNNNINDFLTNKFGEEWVCLDHDLKLLIRKYISDNI